MSVKKWVIMPISSKNFHFFSKINVAESSNSLTYRKDLLSKFNQKWFTVKIIFVNKSIILFIFSKKKFFYKINWMKIPSGFMKN